MTLLVALSFRPQEKTVFVGHPKDTPESIHLEAAELKESDLPKLNLAAERGDARAQLMLGEVYAVGSVVREDDGKSAEWYRKSADQGNAIAQLLLCNAYQHGYGVPKEGNEGVGWCLKAAEQGLAEAQAKLASLYRKRKDSEAAAEWASKAAEQGYFIAQINLANMYEIGEGVQQDKVTAYMWLLVAKESLCGPPQKLCIEIGKGDPTKAETYFCGPSPQPCVERYPEFKAAQEKFAGRIAAELSPDEVEEAIRRAREWAEKFRAAPAP